MALQGRTMCEILKGNPSDSYPSHNPMALLTQDRGSLQTPRSNPSKHRHLAIGVNYCQPQWVSFRHS